MKHFFRFICLFIFIFFISTGTGQTQSMQTPLGTGQKIQGTGQNNLNIQKDDYEEVFQLAAKLEEEGLLNQAFVEYSRYIFLQDYSEGIHRGQAYLSLSLIYEKNENFPKALENIQMAQAFDSSDFLKLKEIEILRNYSQKKKISLENNQSLFKYRFMPDYSLEIKKQAFLAILENEIITEQFDLFKENFSLSLINFPNLFSEENCDLIEKTLQKIEKFKPKNPNVAKVLSIVPGLGQLYAGNPGDALNAFLLDSSLLALSAYSVYSFNFCDFLLFELPATVRFYQGNFVNAQKHSYEYNSKKITELKSPILEILK